MESTLFTEKQELDVLSIDTEIKKKLDQKKKVQDIGACLNKLKKIKDESVDKEKIQKQIDALEKQIEHVQSTHTLNMYIAESVEIVEKYKQLLKKPIQMSFMGKSKTSTKEKDELVEKFKKIYIKYAPDLEKITTHETHLKPKCIFENCDGSTFLNINESLVCEKCSGVQSIQVNKTSYSDIDRVNVSSRYLYDRKIHFRDCILQFQGRQNVTIEKSVYESLETALENHHLLIGDKNTPVHIRFKNITKEHISMFLKELRLSKHYENIQLIHYNLTGKPSQNISHLEGALLQDFEQLTSLYDKIYKNEVRKNFINTQYVLFQLLKRHKYECSASDFSIIKTSERRAWHHSVCRRLFEILNWNFTGI